MDDFFLGLEQHGGAPPGGNVDRALFEEVLIPLREGEDPSTTARFDWCDVYHRPRSGIKAGNTNIVEGAYSMHPDPLRRNTIHPFFLPTVCRKQRERILKRNAPAHKAVFRPLDPFSSSALASTRSMCEPLRSHPFEADD